MIAQMTLNLTNKTNFIGKINAHKIALDGGVVLFLGDLALGEFFSENLLFENERERFAKEANLAHSQKFRASRVLKFWALNELLGGNLCENSQNGVNFGENLGANSNLAAFGDKFVAKSNLNLAKFKGDFAKNLAFAKMRDELEKKWRKTRLHLCLSHSGALVALACAPFKIGFDIEQIKPRNTAAVMDFCFNPHEKMRILYAENAVILDEFYRIFTAKEALIKLCDLTFADFDKVGFTADNKIRFASTHTNLNTKNIQTKHHKFSIQGQEFMACCAF